MMLNLSDTDQAFCDQSIDQESYCNMNNSNVDNMLKDDPFLDEEPYGLAKRLRFTISAIQKCKPKSLLDIGCGTGVNLTLPLAKRFPSTDFVGVDTDDNSLDIVRKESETLPNLSFCDANELDPCRIFDFIIASEVIEHVEEPYEFLLSLNQRLSTNGTLLLTLPNGYGPFEFAMLSEVILRISRVYYVLRHIKCLLTGKATLSPDNRRDSLAICPHINFFSYRQICAVIRSAGFVIDTYRPRTFLCGFGFVNILRNECLLRWNTSVADRLPPLMNSGWMFILKKNDKPTPSSYKRNLFARLRRH